MEKELHFYDHNGNYQFMKFHTTIEIENTLTIFMKNHDVLHITLMAYTDKPFYIIDTSKAYTKPLTYEQHDFECSIGDVVCNSDYELECWLRSFIYERDTKIDSVIPCI